MLVHYQRSLPFETRVVQENTKLLVSEKKEVDLHTYHFDVIDSTMNICAKWPDFYVTDKHCFAFIADG